MITKTTLYCPVGNHTRLGVLTKGEVCSFVCTECKFIFTWGRDGLLRPPVKIEERVIKKCGCGGCRFRDERL